MLVFLALGDAKVLSFALGDAKVLSFALGDAKVPDTRYFAFWLKFPTCMIEKFYTYHSEPLRRRCLKILILALLFVS